METVADTNAFLRDNLAAPPFHQWLRPELVEYEPESGKTTVRLRNRPEFRRDHASPAFHGGVLATLIDIAGHMAVAARVGHGVPTIDLRVDYLRMAAGEVLLAEARPLRLGRSIAVVDIRVLDDQSRLVACGRGAYSTKNA